MFDFETLGTNSRYPILTIGYTYFNPEKLEDYCDILSRGEEIVINIEEVVDAINSQKKALSASTLLWWMKQSNSARASAFRKTDVTFEEGWSRLNNACRDANNVWSYGAMDFSMLSDELEVLGIAPAFSYRDHMDLRTLVKATNYQWPTQPEGFVAHNALHDACFQAYCAQRILLGE